jgi:hypothetical protein
MKQNEIVFTERQKSILLGSMLGDGTLDKVHGRVKTSRFSEVHGIAQCDWLKWKQKQLEPLPSLYKEGTATARKNLGNGVIVQ